MVFFRIIRTFAFDFLRNPSIIGAINKGVTMQKIKSILSVIAVSLCIGSGVAWGAAADMPMADPSSDTAGSAAAVASTPGSVSGMTIVAIEVEGNKTVSLAKITTKIKTRVSSAYNPNVLSDDIKRLYSLGFFERVWVEEEKTPAGIKVIFKVAEKPLLKNVIFEGNKRIHYRVLEKESEIKKGMFVDDREIKNATEKIKDLYVKRGYPLIEIKTQKEIDPKTNETTVRIIITESAQYKITSVDFKGNTFFTKGKLSKVVKTRKKWLFFSGVLKEDTLKDDIKRVEDIYKVNGYEDVKVKYDYAMESSKDIKVVFTIAEGKRYYTGKVSIEGYQNIKESEIRNSLKMTEGKVFSNTLLKDDVVSVQSLYFNKGYIFIQVVPMSTINKETDRVDVHYKIKENDLAYINMIEVRGNQRTQDKVIRRELKIKPGEQFDGEKLKKSKEKLEHLGFFEEIRFDTEHSSKPNWENLVVDVKESKTGTFSFGGGYSSVDQFVGFVELRQRNFDFKNYPYFVGAGQDVSLNASMGSITQNLELSFTNPWIFDRPISFGFDGYLREHERETDVGYGYDEKIVGGDVRFGKSFNDRVKGSIGLRHDSVRISNISDDATSDLKDEEGTNDINSVELGAVYDTRDNPFFPLKGLFLTGENKIAGVGGDKEFLQFVFRESVYFPMIRKSVFEFKLRQGIAKPYGNTEKIPIYERFFAGGAYTIRGYHERKVGPIDPVTKDPLGGESMFIANLEYTYPLVDFLKIAAFFDSGNVWAKSSDFCSGGFKSGVGFGLRVKTPFGPISLDYGIPLNKEPGETDLGGGRFHFSVSRGF